MGSDASPRRACQCRSISIHAPAWGATGRLRQIPPIVDISIHAPAWGATTTSQATISDQRISIHAPAWGATLREFEVFLPTRDFNPRSRMGSDIYRCERANGQRISIHAPAWGATVCLASSSNGVEGFQSTLPHGERLGSGVAGGGDDLISIHAPAWGATASNTISGFTR